MDLKSKELELARVLMATAEFIELKRAEAVIGKNPDLKKEVDLLKRKQMELYQGGGSAKEAEARLADLDRTFGQLSGIPEFSRYLKANSGFNKLLNETYRNINDILKAGLR